MAGTRKRATKAPPKARRKGDFEKLDKALENALKDYFKMLAGYEADHLHKLVFEHIEKKLLKHVLKFAQFNQSRAAAILGLSRSTLRSKIRAYGIATGKTRAAKKH